MNRRLQIGLGLALLVAVAASAQEIDTRVLVDDSGRLQISELPHILGNVDVERHLSSGLTTSFLFRVRPQRSLPEGASRIDIRLELWDEAFLVSVIDGEGRISTLEHASLEDLRTWWAEAQIVASGPSGASPGELASARVSLDVIPFSQAELNDTQRWLAESMSQSQARQGVSRAVGVLIATSIQRRTVRSWTWIVPVERQEDR